jgi:hypothetical protein
MVKLNRKYHLRMNGIGKLKVRHNPNYKVASPPNISPIEKSNEKQCPLCGSRDILENHYMSGLGHGNGKYVANYCNYCKISFSNDEAKIKMSERIAWQNQ